MQNWKLGIALFFMEMGGILGAKVLYGAEVCFNCIVVKVANPFEIYSLV